MTDLQKLEKTRIKYRMTTVAFVKLFPIARSTYYGWLKGRTPDTYRMARCLEIAKNIGK